MHVLLYRGHQFYSLIRVMILFGSNWTIIKSYIREMIYFPDQKHQDVPIIIHHFSFMILESESQKLPKTMITVISDLFQDQQTLNSNLTNMK